MTVPITCTQLRCITAAALVALSCISSLTGSRDAEVATGPVGGVGVGTRGVLGWMMGGCGFAESGVVVSLVLEWQGVDGPALCELVAR